MFLSGVKKAIPHGVAFAIFLLVSIVFCKPALEGKVVEQHDMRGYKGMAQQSYEYREKQGHFPLWTESMFSGMPAYNIAMEGSSGISIGWVGDLLSLGLPKPINFFFLACICFYFLSLVLRIDPRIGILAALSYAYSSYDPIIIVVGHETKMLAIAYAPGVIAGLLVLYDRQYVWGTALLTLFFALQMSTQHLQIVYYTLIGMGLLTISRFVYAWKAFYNRKGDRGELKSFLVTVPLAVCCGFIGWGCWANSMLPVQEYTKESMRGGRTELTGQASGKDATRQGLNNDYAFQWSYGIGETLTLVVPNIYGSGNQCREIGEDSKFAGKIGEAGVPEDTGLQMANAYAYWGGQELGTAGPVYLGAVICFLFIIGIFYVKGWPGTWLVSFAFLGILLSWGKHFSVFNDFVFHYLPFYDKFRAPTMALFMPQLAFPLLGALGLNELADAGRLAHKEGTKTNETKQALWGPFQKVLWVIGGLVVLLLGFYFMAAYKGSKDPVIRQNLATMFLRQQEGNRQPAAEIRQQAFDFSGGLMKALERDRQSLYGADLLRSLLLIAVALVLTVLYLKERLRAPVLLGGLLLLCSFDILAIGRRYLNEENFEDPADFQARFVPTPADLQIRKDPEKNFRVFEEDAAEGWYQDSRASYFFNSIGGYHPAKLGLYEDIMGRQLMRGNMLVYDMLNTKYFIQKDPATGQPVARRNPGAYGPCWLVRHIHYVKDGDEEMKALDSIPTRDTVIIQEKYRSQARLERGAGRDALPGSEDTFSADSTASLTLTRNLNDTVDYHFSGRTDQFAVFSEIYYEPGWGVWLDGTKAGYLRVDYLLRGMPIPAGEHCIEFRFEPQSYKLGNRISVLSSVVAYLLLAAAIVSAWRRTPGDRQGNKAIPSSISSS
ncbi:MAG: hypothetical protein P4L51_04140 [Puia sp.]|nr:hypothetical protein [Puia sp.]